MTTPATVQRYGFPHVTIPRSMLEQSPPAVMDTVRGHIKRATDRWLSMSPAEREAELDARDARREAERDDWLRTWIADERTLGLDAVDAQLDQLCETFELDPYDTWRRPRAAERLDRFHAMTATIRRDLNAAGHRPVTSGLEARLPRVVVDGSVPAGTAELRTEEGTVIGRIVGIQ